MTLTLFRHCTQIRSYEGQVASLQGDLEREREAFQRKVGELEAQMAQFYEQYLAKTKECTMAREVQVALQAEIAAFRAIIEAEEKEIHQGCHH